MWKMKTAIIITFALLLLSPVIVRAHEEVGGMVIIVSGYQVRLISPDVVRVGENQFQVVVTGADGLPVSGAMIEAAAEPISKEISHEHAPTPVSEQPSHSGHSPAAVSAADEMDGHAAKTVKLTAAPQAGLYEGAISFSKDGPWTLSLHLMIGSEMLNVKFPLDVAYTTPAAYGIIAAFLSLNVVILASAAILRVKSEE